MANLPLETHPIAHHNSKKQRKRRDVPPLIVSAALLLGVLLSDALAIWHLAVVLLFCGALCIVICRQHHQTAFAIMGITAFVAGCAAHYFEAYHHKVSLITESREAVVEAVIIKHERQDKGRARLWLDDVRIDRKEVDGIVRATIDQMPKAPLSYQAHFTGRLRIYPLSGALFPNWPDYSRKSWREGIIATAYGRAPIITPSPTQTTQTTQGARPVIAKLRDAVSGQISDHLSPASASLAKALLIGERDFSNEAFFTPFRNAGLAHLLAISGLHMGLFCFGVYGVCRLCLALPVRLSAIVAPHKIAVFFAIASGLFYLALTGYPISAIRAYLMVSIVLLALLIGRRMVTVRSMTIVFCLFLLLYPTALYLPAFQLSFAATFGIVLFHDRQKTENQWRQNKWLKRTCYLAATSAIAIVSTFFITAFHFGVISAWGVVSNIIAIPYTGLVIMPVVIAYLISLALGFGLWVAPLLDVILSLLILFAQMMASLPHSEIRLPIPPPPYLPLFAIMGAGLFYGAGKGRLVILSISIVAIILWLGQGRPFAVVTGQDDYRRIAVYDDATLYHNHRLTKFWAQSYGKLFGNIEKMVRVNCRHSCRIKRIKEPHNILITAKPNRPCSTEDKQLTLTLNSICHRGIYHYDNRGNISLLLFYNNNLGVYSKQK